MVFKIKNIDHYAVIVNDIEQSQKFHINFLGFKFVRSYKLKTSDDSQEESDSYSVVLEKITTDSREICVLNKPLNSSSFLNKYLAKYGEGIHHIAYAVDDINEEFSNGLRHNISFTSDKVVADPVNKLLQVFIDRKYTGYYIELIQRSTKIDDKNLALFSLENIKDLMISTSKNL